MPIIFEAPVINTHVGPGTQIRVAVTLPDVHQPGDFWELLVVEDATENVVALASNRLDQTQATLWLATDRDINGIVTPQWRPQPPLTAFPTPARLSAVLKDASNSVIAQTSEPVVWNPTPAGAGYVAQLQAQGTVQGGFTEDDRLVMGTINAAVYSAIPVTTIGGSAVQLGLENLLKGPPIDFLAESPDFLISGRTSINRPGNGVGTLAYGYRWRIETAPAGLGKLDGQVVEYEQRIAQFAVIKTRLGGGEYVAQLQNSHDGSGEATWGLPFPVRVDFDVLPGVVVRFAWLLFAQ